MLTEGLRPKICSSTRSFAMHVIESHCWTCWQSSRLRSSTKRRWTSRKRRSLKSRWTPSPSAPPRPPRCWTRPQTPPLTRSSARSRLMRPSRQHPTSTCLRLQQFQRRAQVRINALAKSQKHLHLLKNGHSVFLEAALRHRESKKMRAHERKVMEAPLEDLLKNLRLEILSRDRPRKAPTLVNLLHPPALRPQVLSALPPHLCLQSLPSTTQ